MINKKARINYLFQRIEQNDLKEVKHFFEEFPEFLKQKELLRSINDWTPAYYCARFGYIKLLKFFFEEVKMNDDKAFLLLLSIHSGSLPVMYYLYNKSVQTYELMMMLYSSCNLGKVNLGLFILLRGAMVYDDINIQSPENGTSYPLCYNLSYKINDGHRIFYDKKGQLLFEESETFSSIADFQSKKPQRERSVFILSHGNSKIKIKLLIIASFRIFNFGLIKELAKQNYLQMEGKNYSRTKYAESLSIINKNDFLKNIFDSYYFVKR